MKALASSYRFQSFTEYKALLSIYNVQAEEVKGEVNGKPYNGIVYSATNDKGEKQGNPFKSSSLGKSVGYEAIQRHIKKSTKDIQDKNLKERTRRTVGAVMKSAHSRKELEQELKRKGIDVLFRQNDTGRIYGVTFIDHENRTVLNGSRLGKDFPPMCSTTCFPAPVLCRETANRKRRNKNRNITRPDILKIQEKPLRDCSAFYPVGMIRHLITAKFHHPRRKRRRNKDVFNKYKNFNYAE